MDKAKPFCISKQEVWDAYERVKANHGAAGVDGQSVAAFEENLINNLYKLWNRLSSGSYFPPPVRRVEIPKSGGGTRPLGIPTVADRIAQMVVKRCLEPNLDRLFHPDSYGYRPGKSAIEAVGQARQRCWDYDWVLDLDAGGLKTLGGELERTWFQFAKFSPDGELLTLVAGACPDISAPTSCIVRPSRLRR